MNYGSFENYETWLINIYFGEEFEVFIGSLYEDDWTIEDVSLEFQHYVYHKIDKKLERWMDAMLRLSLANVYWISLAEVYLEQWRSEKEEQNNG